MILLKMGSRGEAVKHYQRLLCLADDGIFGKLTEQYVRLFQTWWNDGQLLEDRLWVDGIIGPQTALALASPVAQDYLRCEINDDNKSDGKNREQSKTLPTPSQQRLLSIHPDLARVVRLAYQGDVDFMVIEGKRSLATQKRNVARGASKTMNSRHLTGHAVDLGVLLNGKITWDWPHYERLANNMKQAARQLNIPIEWGGDWKSFKDGVHFQLPHAYPK